QFVLESRARGRDRRRPLAPLEKRPPLFAVEAAIREPDLGAAELGFEQSSTLTTLGAADLEDVGEVGVEIEGDRETRRRATVVQQPHAFVPRAAPQKTRS